MIEERGQGAMRGLPQETEKGGSIPPPIFSGPLKMTTPSGSHPI